MSDTTDDPTAPEPDPPPGRRHPSRGLRALSRPRSRRSLTEPPPVLHPIQLVVTDDLRRSRLTVLLRLPLSVPHLIWLYLWSILVVFAVWRPG